MKVPSENQANNAQAAVQEPVPKEIAGASPTSGGIPPEVQTSTLIENYSLPLRKVIEEVLSRSSAAANLFPLMPENELRELIKDITVNGQLRPVIMDGDSKILDGRNREIARIIAGKVGYYNHFNDIKAKRNSDVTPITFVISENINRRHLSTSQRAMIAADLVPLLETEAKLRQGKRTDKGQDVPTEFGRSTEKAGEALHVSSDSVKQAVVVKEKGTPELQQAVKSGVASVNAAAKVAGLPKEAQRSIVKSGKAGIRKAAKNTPRKSRRKVVKASPAPSPTSPEIPPAGNPAAGAVNSPDSDETDATIANAAKILDAAARDFDSAEKRRDLAQKMLNGRRPEIVLGQWKTASMFAAAVATALNEHGTAHAEADDNESEKE